MAEKTGAGHWHTYIFARVIDALRSEKLMFEAADPEVFSGYVKIYGAEVNLFVDHSQIVQLECVFVAGYRAGTASFWGRVVTYKGQEEVRLDTWKR